MVCAKCSYEGGGRGSITKNLAAASADYVLALQAIEYSFISPYH